jgi:curved DNA-binding protein CbpA
MARLLLERFALLHTKTKPDRRRNVNYTHYDFLEIAPGADGERIESAYLALLERLQYGASNAGQDLSGLVRQIHAAYDVLSNPNRREAYDAKLAAEAADADNELKALLEDSQPRAQRYVQDVPGTLAAALAQMAA